MRVHSTALRALPAFAILLLSAGAARADLKGSLGLFFELGPQDSVTALEQKSATALQVMAVDMTTTEPKTLEEEIGAKPMAKLLAEARAEGVPVSEWAPPSEPAAGPGVPEPAPAAEASREGVRASPEKSAGRSTTSQRKNRIWYMTLQVPLSTWVYGAAVPIAMDVDSWRVRSALPLLTAPVTFGAHLWFAKSRTFEDAHMTGTTYLSVASLYASYALPFAIMDERSERFRTAAFLSLVTYPLSLWGGYALGDRYLDLPGRVGTQAKFALGFGTLGLFTPFLYFEDLDDNEEAISRLALGQSVAFAVAGHFISEFYRSGENIPGGVTTGILTHAALGAGIGAEIAALSDASSVRPWLGAAIAGGTAGFMEGLWYFRNRYDNNERGIYNLLGTGAGMLMGGGVLILVSDDDASAYAEKTVTTSLLAGGALLGYVATDILTSGMEDRPASGPLPWSDRLAFNPFPVAEAEVRPGNTPGDRQVHLRYRMPGLTFTF